MRRQLNGAFAHIDNVGRNFGSSGSGLPEIVDNLARHDALRFTRNDVGVLSRLRPPLGGPAGASQAAGAGA